ncbi:TonB-dependent siderophore receptor [Termitidicoccus mucosus]|uniref:Ligand-gated channel n=1 Tax=Termitidicoccus mucosus TaxID=1184151 RepID=A0A178IBT7_9BACT|nr:ligand-gated channel [Opitutaceae bacterium TSB47]
MNVSPWRNPSRLSRKFLPALAAVVSFAATLAAQTADEGTDDDIYRLDALTVADRQLAAVTVTTKLPISIHQTPQSISVVDRTRIDTESFFSLNDTLQNTTGINVTFYDSGRPLYFARGFAVNDFQVDGLTTFSDSTNLEYDIALYERVEIVRGANGLLSGAGYPSATVNMQRKRPGKTFAASVAGTLGSWDYRRIEGDVSVPLLAGGRVRARVVGAYTDRDYFLDRFTEDKAVFYGVLEADVTSTTLLAAGWQRQDNNPKRTTWGTIPRFADDGSLARLPRSLNFAANWCLWQRDADTLFVTVDQRIAEGWSLKAAYNRTEGDVQSVRVYATGFPNLATGAGTYLRAGIGEAEDTRDVIDVYLNGRFPLLGREHEFVAGWNYNELERRTPALSSVSGWTYDIPNLWTYDGDIPAPAYARTGARTVATTRQTGLYASLRFRLLDPLSLIGGLRLSQWKTGTDRYDTAGAYTGTTGAYEVSNELTPYAGIVYELNPVWAIYASYTDIFRPQNYRDKNDNLLEPIVGKNIEGGVKAEFFGGRLHASAALFESRQDNYAVRDSSVPEGTLPDGGSAYIGVNGTRTRGFEAELSGQLMSGWTAHVGYTYADTKRHALDLIYVNLPDHLVRLSTQYRLPGAFKALTVGGAVNWQSKTTGYNIPHPTLGAVTVTEDGYALVNVNLNLRLSDRVSATLTVRNLFDKTYWATIDYPNYGEPRNVILSLRWNY